ncbi:hypothetical protein VCHA36P166_50162 [Vibrio chagasii]|uniref:hypothetical protein n=1 Tax=Vibrio crassostreae TaxID=246167 RepID=UPI001B3115ED|nr:hypothetical protein [Vibrio crassostreae]CAH7047165.1 hypothetical protein VCHA36P166_50162 [Vibrio chagasii]
MISIRQVKDPEEAKRLVLYEPFWDLVGRGASKEAYLNTLRYALIYSHDEKAVSIIFIRGPATVEWHCYIYPDHRKHSVPLCESFLTFLKDKGVKEVKTIIPSRFKATQNFALKRLFFTQDKEQFVRLL